jgi:hypothetical protein
MTRSFRILAALILVTGCASLSRQSALTEAELAITHIAVIDVEQGRVVPGRVVLVKGTRILGVLPAAETRLPATVRVIDGSGKYVMPGLWDMHVHLTLGGNPLQAVMPLFVANGVTGARVMGADRPSATPSQTLGLSLHRNWQARIASGEVIGPRIMGLATWAVNGAAGISDSMPAFYKARTREEGQQLARYFKDRGFDFIKVYNNVSREGYLGLTDEARRLGLPFAGHEPASVSALELSAAGQASIEHSRIFLFNCFPGADSLQKGLLRLPQTVRLRRMVDEYDARRCADVFAAFARNRTWITPTHVTRRMDAFADDSAYRNDPRMKYIPLPQQIAWHQDANGMVASDSTAAGRLAFMDFYRKGLSLTNDAYRAGVPVMVGTDAGDSFVFPGSSVHDELGELVKAGLSPAEALRAATLSSASFVQRTSDFGTVQSGRYADLVVLDANPLADIANVRRINAVILNGRVFSRPALDSMLASVETAVRPDAQTRLIAASITGDTVALGKALDAGAKIDSLVGTRRPLNWAALNNRAAAVRFLLARGAGINLQNATGFTPVHHAAEAGALDALTALIAAGADVSIASRAGVLPLTTARQRGNAAVVRVLEAATKPQ